VVKCELCPVQNYCPILRRHQEESPRPDTHIDYEDDCPLYELVYRQGKEILEGKRR
jgi:adenine-specific DNA glycosylase